MVRWHHLRPQDIPRTPRTPHTTPRAPKLTSRLVNASLRYRFAFRFASLRFTSLFESSRVEFRSPHADGSVYIYICVYVFRYEFISCLYVNNWERRSPIHRYSLFYCYGLCVYCKHVLLAGFSPRYDQFLVCVTCRLQFVLCAFLSL